jgi:predicted HD phosphohydrolase
VDVAAAESVEQLCAVLAAADGVFDSLGPDGDPVDILAHSLQCADVLSETAPDDPELQVAGLVHDVGHVVAAHQAESHGRTGAAYVGPLLGARVARLTELHVPAKRYLVTTEAAYAGALSDGSTRSLELQGGVLDAAEQARLESDPDLGDALTLRRADEAAKVVGRRVPGLDRWRAVLAVVARRRGA